MPMQPQAPLIRARGEGELILQTQPTFRPEIATAYSPLNHLVVAAGGVWRPSLRSGQDGTLDGFHTLQYELGAGTYWNFGPHWTGLGTFGIGAAQAQRFVTEADLFPFSNFYEARYRKRFGQLSFTHQQAERNWGFGYRLTQVTFSELAANDTQSGSTQYILPLDGQLRHEPFGFIRFVLGPNALRHHWSLQANTALSFCVPGRGKAGEPFDAVRFRAQFNRGGYLLVSGAIVYQFAGRRTNN
ncbi:MAG: hypothetical protein WKG07_12700 [Hymenobacter sp.]